MHTLIVNQVIDNYTSYQRKSKRVSDLHKELSGTCILQRFIEAQNEYTIAAKEKEEALATLLCSIEQLKSI